MFVLMDWLHLEILTLEWNFPYLSHQGGCCKHSPPFLIFSRTITEATTFFNCSLYDPPEMALAESGDSNLKAIRRNRPCQSHPTIAPAKSALPCGTASVQ